MTEQLTTDAMKGIFDLVSLFGVNAIAVLAIVILTQQLKNNRHLRFPKKLTVYVPMILATIAGLLLTDAWLPKEPPWGWVQIAQGVLLSILGYYGSSQVVYLLWERVTKKTEAT